MSVAFTKEGSAETAAETFLPDRPVPEGPNLVTAEGLAALERQLSDAQAAYDAAMTVEDVDERRRQGALPFRDIRYYAERVRTAQVVPPPIAAHVVTFGSTVTFEREDGRVQTYRIVGEDEADPRTGTISFGSPIARALMGKGIGEVTRVAGSEVEVLEIR